ncbi:Serine/threonine protein kinase, partial [Globisporangium polare]
MHTQQRQHAESLSGPTGTGELLLPRNGITHAAASISSRVKLLEIADVQGFTPVLAAAWSGRFKVAQYLMSIGSSVHTRANDGETILVSAARWRNLSIIAQLSELGWLLSTGNSDEGVPLLMATLQTLKEYAPQLHEFQQMWLRLVDRLVDIHDRVAESPDSSRDAVLQFVMIVFNAIRLKATCESNNVVARLVASPTIATRFRDFHTELTYLEAMLNLGSFESLRMEWEIRCGKDEVALLQLFQASIGDPGESSDSTRQAEDDQLESSCLLQHKMQAQGDTCSPDLKSLLDLSLCKLHDANVKLPSVPKWFIPPHELDVNETSDDHTPDTAIQSKWTSSVVMVSQHRMPREKFIATIETCFQLSHPNVIRVFGASHIRSPFLAVFENAQSTSLREYLARDENKHLLWQKLFEVSLGLKYLIERGIVLGALRCDDIWVGTDGLAKVNALNCVASQEEPGDDSQCVRWQAPEVLRGAASSSESSIWSLGMCIWEAFTGEVPWGSDTIKTVIAKVLYNRRLQLPEHMPSDQSGLLESMWRSDPSKRPTIASVVIQLKQFADEQISKHKSSEQNDGRQNRDGSQPLNLERHIFPDIDSTIEEYLVRLEEKLRWCRESQEEVRHILERLRDVYGLLRTQHRPPGNVAVESYCELLSRLNRFLGSAYHKQS